MQNTQQHGSTRGQRVHAAAQWQAQAAARRVIRARQGTTASNVVRMRARGWRWYQVPARHENRWIAAWVVIVIALYVARITGFMP